MSFQSLTLHPSLLQALSRLGHTFATPIQEIAIPPIIQGRDVIAAAETGSGKTAAYLLPILQRFQDTSEDSPFNGCLILVPTRELAQQVADALVEYGQDMPRPPRSFALYGGVDIEPQIAAAQDGADILVATPGRLLDLAGRGAVDLSQINTLVLDEADRLLALGFAEELDSIIAQLPVKRQNLLFSATFPPAVVEITNTHLTNPEKIQLEIESRISDNIAQRAFEVERVSRTALLRHLLKTENWTRALVFVATKRKAANLAAKLSKYGIQASVLHGDLKQAHRARALENFKNGKIQALMATDLAARGIDIAQLPCVINYDLPRSPADYLHRIGRTGRAGESGTAISFVSIEDHQHFQLIEKKHSLAIERERIEGFEPAEWNPDALPTGTAPVKGKRKSKKDKSREAAARKARAKRPEPEVNSTDTLSIDPPALSQNSESKTTSQTIPAKIEEPSSTPKTPQPPESDSPWAQSLKTLREREDD